MTVKNSFDFQHADAGTAAEDEAPVRREVDLGSDVVMRRLSGAGNENLKLISESTDVKIGSRGQTLTLTGAADHVAWAERIVTGLGKVAKKNDEITAQDIIAATQVTRDDVDVDLTAIFFDVVIESRSGKRVSPKGPAQKQYIDAIRSQDIVFGVGPAGTGKTYLAVASAAAALKHARVKHIILTRPAVEAGERLGFLPGDLEAKINPYLRPLHDALFDLFGADEVAALVEKKVIEVAPLAFMRGRTLNDAFVILDEAQNATIPQMKMFLTRLGFGSKMVITGDVTQTDLPGSVESGLRHALRILRPVNGVAQCFFSEVDVVRHRLVQRIIQAYDGATERGRV